MTEKSEHHPWHGRFKDLTANRLTELYTCGELRKRRDKIENLLTNTLWVGKMKPRELLLTRQLGRTHLALAQKNCLKTGES